MGKSLKIVRERKKSGVCAGISVMGGKDLYTSEANNEEWTTQMGIIPWHEGEHS